MVLAGFDAAASELSIHVTTHHVAAFGYHAKIFITTDDTNLCSKCEFIPITSRPEIHGRCDLATHAPGHSHFVSLGADSNPAWSPWRDTHLRGKQNRGADAIDGCETPPRTITVPSGTTELDEVFELVLAMQNHVSNYDCTAKDLKMDYSLFPDGKATFNSNSFVRGILEAVGLDADDVKPRGWFLIIPGFDKPVLPREFEVRCS